MSVADDIVTLSRQDFDRFTLAADKLEIFELSATYMRGLDRLDRDLLLSVYHEDATDDRGFFKGDALGFVEFAMGALSPHAFNHHMLGQANIDVEGDVAFGEVYFQAFHRVEEDGEEKDFVVLGRYVDRYERRGGVWKIAHRTELNDFSQELAASDFWLKSTPEALRGFRGQDDLSSQREKVRGL